MDQTLGRHIEHLSNASSLAEAAIPLRDIGLAIGLQRPAAVEDFCSERLLMSQRGGLLGEIFGWLPSQGANAVGEPSRHICPIGRACRVTFNPFVWRSSEINDASFSWDRRSRDFWLHAAELGLVGGVTVPVHLPLSRVAAVGWLSFDRAINLEAIVETWRTPLRMAAHLFMDHVYRERPDIPGSAPDAELSERELECLTWVALGKTDAEIGALIGRSPSTARFHVDSAAEKLGANNRARAAAVACQLGMIRAVA